MKLVISRNEPWALSVAAATATTTAAVLLLLLLPQTSRTSAIGMQEEQQQLPPSALPAARFVLYVMQLDRTAVVVVVYTHAIPTK